MGAQAGIEYDQNIPDDKHAVWCWGHRRVPRQKGIVSYAIARNQFRIGYLFYQKGGVFNVVRRSRNQFLYVVPPFVAAYMLMEWANEKNEFLNSKAGRAQLEAEGGAA